MKSWKKAVLVFMSMFLIGSMTACAGENRVNDATRGSNTGETLDDDIKDGTDALEDGAKDLKDDVENGAKDIKDGVEDALDGNGRKENDK